MKTQSTHKKRNSIILKIEIIAIIVLIIVILVARYKPLSQADKDYAMRLNEDIKKLEHLHQKPAKPGPNDWLTRHKEKGQSFKEYIECDPVRPNEKRNKLYVLPLGTFDKRSAEIIEDSATFMGLYFQTPVVLMKTRELDQVPNYAKRENPYSGSKQLLSTWVLDDYLKPQLPDDALALIAFTAIDLWPGDDWNFVFGQASLYNRVGVWSIARNGDPNKNYPLCLMRTLKTATHETGHMLSIKHCIAWHCNMAGANTLDEADRNPLYLCPECVAKIAWATNSDLSKRYLELLTFAEKHNMKDVADFYKLSIDALKASK